jgi:hypothetical protein
VDQLDKVSKRMYEAPFGHSDTINEHDLDLDNILDDDVFHEKTLPSLQFYRMIHLVSFFAFLL